MIFHPWMKHWLCYYILRLFLDSCCKRMTGIITRSHRVNHAKWKHMPKERSCRNVVRHLISAMNLHKKSARSCTGGVYNEKQTKVMESKKGFCQELDKKTVPKAKHVQTSVSLENEDSRERPAVSVYSRITRAKSKFISGNEVARNDTGGDVACKDAGSTVEREKSKTGLKEHKMCTGENISQIDAKFVVQIQDRMIEGRMTRSRKNTLLQIHEDKEIEGAGHPNDHTNGESCIGKPDKNPILTYDHTLQRKRKRMSATMYGEELDDSYGFTGKDLASESRTKNDFPVGVTTRSAIHKQNPSTTINNQIIDKQSNDELQDECKKGEVTQQEQLEFAAHLESQEKSKSCKWKDLKENLSSPRVLKKLSESSEQKDEILLGTRDSHLSKNLRNTRSTVGRGIVDSVLISDPSPQKNLGEKVLVNDIKGSRKGKVIAMTSIPKRMTRSMQKDSSNLKLVEINEKHLISHKRKRPSGGHSLIARKSLRMKKQPSLSSVDCTEKTQSGDKLCVQNDNSLKMKSAELEDKDQCKNGLNHASGKLNLSESVEGIVDLKGKRPLYWISKKKEKNKFDARRKEYLTRSKDNELHSSPKAEGSISPCYKNELNSSIEGPGGENVLPPIDEPTVMLPNESYTAETYVRQFPMDTGIEVHLCLKGEGEEKSFLQDPSHLEQPVKTPVGNQLSHLCYEQIYNDIVPETPGYKNLFCNGSRKLNLHKTIKGRGDFAGNGNLYGILKRKEKLKFDIRRKQYLTRSKHVERNIQEDEDDHSSFKAELLTSCDTSELNSNTKEPREVDVPIITEKLVVLPPAESAKVDTSVGNYSMDKDSADHVKLKWEGQTMSSQQSTPSLKLLEKYHVDNQSFPLCYGQICNNTIPETMGRSNAVGKFQLGTPLVVSNIDQGDAKAGDLAGSNNGPIEVSACHVESSHGFDGNSCQVSRKETCETTLKSGINFDPVRKSDESGVDEHDCVPHDEFISDGKKKCFKIVNNPNDLGGRQMRPRPLDPLQPLPIFIEGRNQEFHDLNSTSFQWQSTLHGEEKFSTVAESKSEHVSSSLKSKKQEIKIPSYRTVPDYDEVRRSLNGGKSVYTVPGPYIRHIVSDKNQNTGSEYDLEEDDEEWLRNFNEGNAERKISLQLTEDKIEELIEYFEMESAKISEHLVTNDPVVDSLRDSTDKCNPIGGAGKEEIVLPGGKDSSMPSNVPQTSDCCICNGGEDSVLNSVYRCKSCGIYVHQSCYGVHGQQNADQAEKLKISDWLCRKCEVLGHASVQICCAICCKTGGALKPTTNMGKWAHVVCALYTNETFFLDSDSMEPIDGVSSVEVRSRRQKRLCYLCGARVGSCERCSVYGCGAVFHISCGVNQGAYFEMQHNNQEVVNVRSFCPGHANDAHLGLVEEGSNVKDTCETPIKDDACVPKRQRRGTLRHRIKSAVRLNRCKTVNSNKTLFVDDSLHTDKNSTTRFLNLTNKSEQQVPRSSDKMQDKDANIGLIEGSVSSKLNANGSQRNQFIELKEVLKENIGPAFLVREVYSYWLCKRAQKKGPLLQKLQQEETAKIHGIFNQDSADIREYFGLKEDMLDKLVGCSPTDYKMVLKKLTGLQRGLKSVRSMANVVIEREKLKAHLISDFTLLSQTKLFAVQKELGLMSCFVCKSSESLLLCAQCKRIFCFQCYKHWKVQGVKSFRILSCKRCFCMDCEAVYKADSVNSPLEKFSMKSPQTDVSQRITEVPKSSDHSMDATVKRTIGLGVEDSLFPRSITNGVCSVSKTEVAEDTDSKVDASVNPNKRVFDGTCNFCIDSHPVDAKGRQRSPCKTVLLSDFADAVNLNNSSLGKSPSNNCDKNVEKIGSNRRKPNS